MKRIFLIAFVYLALTFASCSGTNRQGVTDSARNNDTMNADSVVRVTDTTSTGVDHSASGGTTLKGDTGIAVDSSTNGKK